MGYGGYLDLINATPYDWVFNLSAYDGGVSQYQMNAWDPPATVKSGRFSPIHLHELPLIALQGLSLKSTSSCMTGITPVIPPRQMTTPM